MRGWKPYHTIWAVMSLGWVVQYLVRLGFSPAIVQIKDELGISFGQAGILAAAFFYAYTIMLVPGSLLGERFGRRALLLAASVLWMVASFLTGLVASFQHIFALRFASGLAQAPYWGADRAIIKEVTPREGAALGQGVSMMGACLGMGLGVLLAGYIAQFLGWRWIFFILTLPSLFFIWLLWRFVPPAGPAARSRKGVSYSVILTRPDLWVIYVAGTLGVYGIHVVATWAPAAIVEARGLDLGLGSLYASIFGFAGIPGFLCLGLASDSLSRRGMGRKLLVALSFALAAGALASLGLLVEGDYPVALLGLGIFMAGFFAWGLWSPLVAVLADLVPLGILATAFSFSSTLNSVAIVMAPWLSGVLRDHTGSFGPAFYLAGGLSVLGGILILALSPAFRLGPEKTLTEDLPEALNPKDLGEGPSAA